jgi:ABC-type bacteriocin/lantibiotic exporter with double-glycine peptidase domain
LRGLGFEVADLDEVQSRLGAPPIDGYTLGQLELAARSYGAQTLAVETTTGNLSARAKPFACIAHLTHDHFVLITEIDGDSAQIIDPPHRSTVPLDTLGVIWDRRALLISPRPLASSTCGQRGPRGPGQPFS